MLVLGSTPCDHMPCAGISTIKTRLHNVDFIRISRSVFSVPEVSSHGVKIYSKTVSYISIIKIQGEMSPKMPWLLTGYHLDQPQGSASPIDKTWIYQFLGQCSNKLTIWVEWSVYVTTGTNRLLLSRPNIIAPPLCRGPGNAGKSKINSFFTRLPFSISSCIPDYQRPHLRPENLLRYSKGRSFVYYYRH